MAPGVRLAHSVTPPPNGFGGYGLHGTTTEVAATWTVPTISAGSSVGAASSWVGAGNRNHDFIQIGTLENMIRRAGKTRAVYRAFWSDTDLEFHPHDLGAVNPGDTVSGEMVQHPDGWELHLTDTTHPLRRRWATHYGAGTTFDNAQWYQEDPLGQLVPAINADYPSMSSVTFRQLLVNGHRPTLPYVNADELVSPNGTVLVPTRVHNDTFSVLPGTVLQAQYLRDVAPYNAAAVAVLSAIRRHDQAAIVTGTSKLIAVLQDQSVKLEVHFALTDAPPSVAAGVRALIQATDGIPPALNRWLAGGSRSLKGFVAALNQSKSGKAVNEIRRGLGLPPTPAK